MSKKRVVVTNIQNALIYPPHPFTGPLAPGRWRALDVDEHELTSPDVVVAVEKKMLKIETVEEFSARTAISVASTADEPIEENVEAEGEGQVVGDVLHCDECVDESGADEDEDGEEELGDVPEDLLEKPADDEEAEDEPADDEEAEDEPADEPTDEPTDDEEAEDEEAEDEEADDEHADDEHADDEEAEDEPADEPADDEEAGDEPADDEAEEG